MKAIVIATGINTDLQAINEHYPTGLIPLVNRPFIQYVIEHLIENGVFEFEFILTLLPEKIEEFIGDGKRWGVNVNYHLCRDETTPYGKLIDICSTLNPEELFVLAHADRVPKIQLTDLTKPIVFFEETGSHWSGWALLNNQNLKNLPHNSDEEVIQTHLLKVEKCAIQLSPSTLRVCSYVDILQAQRDILTKKFTGMMLSGREAEDGIWLSRNVSLHPTAKLIAPVFIGENSRIGMGVHLGPNAVIGNDCVLDSRSTAINSLILSGSYVGEALELADSIVDKNHLININLGVAVTVADDFILGSLHKNHLKTTLMNFASRTTGMILLLLGLPILLLMMLILKIIRGQVFYKYDAIKLPASSDANSWQQFQIWSFVAPFDHKMNQERGLRDLFMRFLPALINIARGELHFVGVRPLPKYRVKMLAQDWQTLYLNSKPGIVTEASIVYGNDPTTDEIYSSESFYSVMSSFTFDLRLLGKYLSQTFNLSPNPSEKKTRLQE
jgi:NDP-sugar pyrophosphorylase family protein